MTIYFGSQECEPFRPPAEIERGGDISNSGRCADSRIAPPWLKNVAVEHFCRSREQYILDPAGEKSGGLSQRLSKKNVSSTRIALPSSPMRVSSLARNQGTGFRHSSAGSTVIPNPSRMPAILARKLTMVLYAEAP